MRCRLFLVPVLSLCLAGLSAGASAERAEFPPIPVADHATMRNFPLDDDVLHRLVAASAQAGSMHTRRSRFFDSMFASSIADLGDRWFTPEPRLAAVIRQHGFDQQGFVTALFALASARQAVLYGPDPQGVMHSEFVSAQNAGETNMAFYRAHRAEIDPLFIDSGPMASVVGTDAHRR